MAEMMNGGGNDTALLAELINANRNNDGGAWNNPFMYLILLAFLRGGLLGGGGGAVEATDVNGKLNELSSQISGNQNTNLMMSAINGNKDALNAIANALGLNTATLQSAIQNCCCNTQQSVLKMGYEAQIRSLQDTAALTGRIDQLANGVQQGFASIGFNQQQNTAAIINSQSQNTQRILDAMCAQNTQNLRDKIFEQSQNAQTAYLISQLKTTA